MRDPDVPDYGMTEAEYDNYVEEHDRTPTQDPTYKHSHSVRRPKPRVSVDSGKALERMGHSLHAEAISGAASILIDKELEV